MSPHPPLTEQTVAVRPRRVFFSLDRLTVKCPACKAEKSYELAREPLPDAPYCPACLVPWTWGGA